MNLEKLLASGRDGVLLRFGLGNEYLKAGRNDDAVAQLRRAVELAPTHSASWKLLGKALAAANRPDEAIAAWESGVAAAKANGDVQAIREMEVFVRRARKATGGQ